MADLQPLRPGVTSSGAMFPCLSSKQHSAWCSLTTSDAGICIAGSHDRCSSRRDGMLHSDWEYGGRFFNMLCCRRMVREVFAPKPWHCTWHKKMRMRIGSPRQSLKDLKLVTSSVSSSAWSSIPVHLCCIWLRFDALPRLPLSLPHLVWPNTASHLCFRLRKGLTACWPRLAHQALILAGPVHLASLNTISSVTQGLR